MYGLVNKAIRDLVVAELGEAEWTSLCTRAGVQTAEFASLRSYPDHTTYALVGEVSKTLGVPGEEVLRKFGRFWVKYTGREGHADVFEIYPQGVDGLISFVEDLDDMHARIMMAMPELRPPQIYCERTESGLRVYYESTRKGLGPMVIGLLEGLLEHFGVEGSVTHQTPGGESGHDEFSVEFETAAV